MKKVVYKNSTLRLLSLALILMAFAPHGRAGDKFVKIESLRGEWKFTIGVNDEWLKPDYNDESWEKIAVPSAWESQGFHGYDGYGTYRKSFTLEEKSKGMPLYLYLGYVDDVDQTYLNGHKIGATGTFPPKYQTAYDAKRMYVIPAKYLNFGGKNVLAVKVYDSYQYGGIVSGDVGIYANPNEIPIAIDLQGIWKFKTGDELARKSEKYNDLDWNEIFVPGIWEDQGFRDYDGYAWYRKNFFYDGRFGNEKIVLFLGKIDDVDQVYVNGVEVGSTGEFAAKENARLNTNGYYSAIRGYVMDASMLKEKNWNSIAIRVYDSGGEGGIYEGPAGILSQEAYVNFWRERKKLYSK